MKHLGQTEAAAEIRRRITALQPGDARAWGLMSIGEMFTHVREAYLRAGTADNPVLIKGPLPPAVMKFLALRLPVKWPKSVPTVPDLKREALPPAGDFAEDKQRLLDAFDHFVQTAADRHDHPIFGKMIPWDWQRWGFLHADHHLRQFGR